MLGTPTFPSNHVHHADDVSAAAAAAIKVVVLNYLSDSHCHISHLSSDLGTSEQSQYFRAVSEGDADTEEGGALLEDEVPLTVLCATCEDDWDLIDKILTEQTEHYNSLLPLQEAKETSNENDARRKRKHSRNTRRHRIVGGFGIHPWWAQQATEAAFERLEALLVKHSTAIVAEIGIDTIRFTPPPSPSGASSTCTNRCCDTPSKASTCDENFEAESSDIDNNNTSTNATAAIRTSAMGCSEGLSSEQKSAGAAPRKDHDSDEDRGELLCKQLMVLKRQLSLAARYQRPVSVHVVGKGTYGIITEYFEEIAARNREIMGAVAVHGAVPIGPPASIADAPSSVPPSRDEAAGQPQGEQKDSRMACASSVQQRRLFSQYTPLPPTVVFHGFTGSVDFYKHLVSIFCLSSRERAADAKARAAMEETAYEVTDSSHPIHPAGSSRFAFPCPEFFIGAGPRTTFRTKAFSQLFAKTVSAHTSGLSPDLPNSKSLLAKDVKALRQMPSDFVVLETDTFYAHNYLDGHATKVSHDVWIPEADAETLSAELLKMASIMAKPYRGMSNEVGEVSSAADLPPGGRDQTILRGVLMHCHKNLRRALRHVHPFT